MKPLKAVQRCSLLAMELIHSRNLKMAETRGMFVLAPRDAMGQVHAYQEQEQFRDGTCRPVQLQCQWRTTSWDRLPLHAISFSHNFLSEYIIVSVPLHNVWPGSAGPMLLLVWNWRRQQQGNPFLPCFCLALCPHPTPPHSPRTDQRISPKHLASSLTHRSGLTPICLSSSCVISMRHRPTGHQCSSACLPLITCVRCAALGTFTHLRPVVVVTE